MIIVYSKSCFCGKNRVLLQRVKEYARLKGLKIEERRVGLNKAWAQEAESIGTELPFMRYGDYAINLNEPFEEILG